ncbi:MAG: prolipoprotein diacylglyceryl transferase [Pirellulaceae bacterium]
MQQTFFYIPHWLLDGPLLIGWLVFGLLVFGFLVWRNGWSADAFNFLPVYAIGAVLIYFVIPGIEVTEVNPEDPTGPGVPAGLAIRGYGLMMLLGLVAGIGLAIYRGRQEGFAPEKIFNLAFCMVISGIIGARLFYVIQKADQFAGLPPNEALGKMLNMTEGGLVVYGSLIGASLGGLLYVRFAKLPLWHLADIVAPGMLAGLALGRIGCLLNGCCYGAVCDAPQIAQQFPAGSPPYVRQLETGELLGIRAVTESSTPKPDNESGFLFAESIDPGSLAEQAGVEPGAWFQVWYPDQQLRAVKERGLDVGQQIVIRQQGRVIPIRIADLPDRSLGVWPTQLMSAINAFLLMLLLWFYFPLRRSNGQVFALLIILYSITRFLIELIRRDEFGQFGTSLTISQWISVLAVGAGFALFAMAPPRAEHGIQAKHSVDPTPNGV